MFKKIVLIGRARLGKSRITARFIRYQQLFFKYFVGQGRDFTKVNVRLVVKKTALIKAITSDLLVLILQLTEYKKILMKMG